jgi:hypothetical protein
MENGQNCLWRCAQITPMKFLDPGTETAVRTFLARLPADLRLKYAILYGAREARTGRIAMPILRYP